MPQARTLFKHVFIATIASLFFGNAATAQTVWSGFDFEFVRPDDSPDVRDQLTSNVRIARNLQEGIYNSVTESAYDSLNSTSPAGTRWATDLNNDGKTIAATNWAALTFDPWITAYGGRGQAAGPLPNRLTVRNAVLHLITDNIYLDIQFTQWSQGSGGGFVYNRAPAPPVGPSPTGDYNGNNVVDAADYVVWRDTFGLPAAPAGSGADGDSNGTIDDADFDFWKVRFGNTVPPATAMAISLTVPEPFSVSMLLGGIVLFVVPMRETIWIRSRIFCAKRNL